MNPLRQTALLILTLTLGASPIVAQQPTPEGTTDSAAQPPTPTTEPVAESPAPDSSATGEPGAAASSTKDSPFDYRSSEEISEDLSVSFPVDI